MALPRFWLNTPITDHAKAGKVWPAVSKSWGENARLKVSPAALVTTMVALALGEIAFPALVAKNTLVSITIEPSRLYSENARLLVILNGITFGAGNCPVAMLPSLFVWT